MRGGALRSYQKGDGLSYYQIGRGLGGILCNSLKKIGDLLGVKNVKRKRKRKKVKKSSGLGGIGRRRKKARRTFTDIFTY